MTGVAKNTVAKLLVDLGQACSEYQDAVMRDLRCERVQCDEIWSFCYAKAKNVPDEHKGEFGYGDVWTWTAIDADTKLIPCWLVGERTLQDATAFIQDLAGRLANRVQLTTDGHKPYLKAVERAFGSEIDYATLTKLYGKTPTKETPETRYSPLTCTGVDIRHVQGNPNVAHINTSYVERANLTMRMGMRRFTRLTNAFSKKVEHLAAAVALHFMYYNFARTHRTLGTSPAVAAGVATHIWTVEEIARLLEWNTETGTYSN